jgi:hypothetical protein
MNIMRYLLICLIGLLAVLATGCPQQSADSPDAAALSEPATTDTASTPDAGTSAQATPPALDADAPPPRQLVLMYTGSTFSRPLADFTEQPARGGLPALAQVIIDYQATITRFNQERVANSGGDPSGVVTDHERGFLGEHPYLLFDYGSWCRINDPAGHHYAALYLHMFGSLGYTGIAASRLPKLPPEYAADYARHWPEGLPLIAPDAGVLDGVANMPVYTRMVHGRTWGVAAIPLPPDGGTREGYAPLLDTAHEALTAAGAEYSILLMDDLSGSVVRQLATDTRFTVITGALPAAATPVGQGDLPSDGPLMLPALDAGGKQLGVCHIYYSDTGDRPLQYFLSLKNAVEDKDAPLPFRTQVTEAREAHNALIEELTGEPVAPGYVL